VLLSLCYFLVRRVLDLALWCLRSSTAALCGLCWTLSGRAPSLKESDDYRLRFVPALAAVCRSLLRRKGKNRATCSGLESV
jgi:hypothetical protein